MDVREKSLVSREKIVPLLDKLSEWSLYILILCLPFSKSIIEICITVAFVLFVAKKAITREPIFNKTQLNVAFLIFILSLLPSFISTYDIWFSLRAFVSKNAKFVFLAFFIAETLDNKRKLKNLLTIALISAVITMINAFMQYYVTHHDLLRYYLSFKYVNVAFWDGPTWKTMSFIGFPTASFPYPNDFAAWILIFLLPAIALIFISHRRSRNKIFYTLYLIPLFYLFMLTKARAAWLGFIVGITYLSFFRLRKILLIFLAVFFIIYFSSNRLIAHYTLQFTSIDDRKEMWQNGWKIFKEHPVLGNGINTFFQKYKEIREDRFKNERGSYAHNCFLQMAADTGIIGLSGFLYLLFVFFKTTTARAMKLKDDFYRVFNLGLTAGILAFLAHSFFDTNLYSLPLATLFWFALGLSQAILNTAEKEFV